MVGSHPRQLRPSLDTHPLLSLQMDSLPSIYLAIHGQARIAFKSGFSPCATCCARILSWVTQGNWLLSCGDTELHLRGLPLLPCSSSV